MRPKVIIITTDLQRIAKPIANKHNVVGIIQCAPRKINKEKYPLIYKLMKQLYFIITPQNQTLEMFSKEKKIPYYYMDNGSDLALENWVKTKNPDVIVIYSMSQLLKRKIFDIPKYKTINLHPALLPKYKGPNPWFWHYYNMEKKGGITLHYIDDGEDSGDIIYQQEYDIPLGIKSPPMQDLVVGELGLKLILKALDNIKKLPSIRQEKKSPTNRARNIKKDEHKNIIEWRNWDIERIWHILRGTELWLNAIEQPRGLYKGQNWIVMGYEKQDMKTYNIGQIYKEKNKIFVACKDGKIYLILKFSLKRLILNLVR